MSNRHDRRESDSLDNFPNAGRSIAALNANVSAPTAPSSYYQQEVTQHAPNQPAASYMTGMSKKDSAAGRRSPTLPSKVYDCKSSVVLVQDLIQSGVAELEGGDGKLAYCFFQAKDILMKYGEGSLSERLPVGSRVKCNAWLLDESAKIPYLVSTIWTEGTDVPNSAVDKILGMPEVPDMQMYHKISKDL